MLQISSFYINIVQNINCLTPQL